jgi:hypothetical protein
MWRLASYSRKLFLVGKAEEERRGRIIRTRKYVLFSSADRSESNRKSTIALVLLFDRGALKCCRAHNCRVLVVEAE